MQQIDFLPASYREQNRKLQLQVWRLVVVLLIGGTMAAATLYQHVLKRRAEAEVAAMLPAFQAATQNREAVAARQADLTALQAKAQLYTYLRHPWPRTQILHTLTQSLPDAVTLDEIRITREPIPTKQPAPGTASAEAEQNLGQLLVPQRDLLKLRAEFDTAMVVVSVSGVTSDTAVLHQYLAGINSDPLVAEADLVSIERVRESSDSSSRFTARLVMVAGFGQAGGPAGQLAPAVAL